VSFLPNQLDSRRVQAELVKLRVAINQRAVCVIRRATTTATTMISQQVLWLARITRAAARATTVQLIARRLFHAQLLFHLFTRHYLQVGRAKVLVCTPAQRVHSFLVLTLTVLTLHSVAEANHADKRQQHGRDKNYHYQDNQQHVVALNQQCCRLHLIRRLCDRLVSVLVIGLSIAIVNIRQNLFLIHEIIADEKSELLDSATRPHLLVDKLHLNIILANDEFAYV